MTTDRKNINGICYILDKENKTASVCCLDDDEHYEGYIQIPSIVTYKECYRVCSIGEKAFKDCRELTTITIPDSVTSIRDKAFENCSGLTSISIPDSVTEIGDCAFECCSSLTSISISNTITYIGGDIFYGCSSLTSISIPGSVTSIGDATLLEGAFEGCIGLTSINIPKKCNKYWKRGFPRMFWFDKYIYP